MDPKQPVDSPDMVIAKRLLDYANWVASHSNALHPARMVRWSDTESAMAGLTSSTSRDSAVTASPGESVHPRSSSPRAPLYNTRWKAACSMC
jgi:hypothetical protein